MRPLIDFVHLDDLPWEVFEESHGPQSKLLSMESEDDNSRFVELAAGWSVEPYVADQDFEFFVLSGSLEMHGGDLDGDRLTRYSYQFLPAGTPRPGYATPNGATLLRFVRPARPQPATPVPHLNLRTMPWTPVWSEGFPGGAARKTLRHDPDHQESAWVLGVLPHWSFPVVEEHDYSEEHVILEGSIDTDRGRMLPISYLHHPPGAPHGPSRSRTGLLTFVRASGPFVNRFTPVADPGFPAE